jgi:membrane protein implicated in regulation of membrane protease activity
MNWELFYLVCFVVGFAFTALSFLSGTLHFHFHLPHGTFHAGGHGGGAKGGSGGGFPFINPMSLAVFLAWFGGAGYLLVHLRHVWVFAGLMLASIAGFIGSSLVFLFVGKFLMARDYTLDQEDFDMVGVLGKVSGLIRKEGTGEILYEQMGVRKGCAARSETGEEIARGEEVVVTRYERGVAYVRRWNELAEKAGILPEEERRTSL